MRTYGGRPSVPPLPPSRVRPWCRYARRSPPSGLWSLPNPSKGLVGFAARVLGGDGSCHPGTNAPGGHDSSTVVERRAAGSRSLRRPSGSGYGSSTEHVRGIGRRPRCFRWKDPVGPQRRAALTRSPTTKPYLAAKGQSAARILGDRPYARSPGLSSPKSTPGPKSTLVPTKTVPMSERWDSAPCADQGLAIERVFEYAEEWRSRVGPVGSHGS